MSDDDLPPLQPPEIWLHNGQRHYFGGKNKLPPGTIRGDMRAYTSFYRAAVRERERKIRDAHEQIQVERLRRGEEAEPPLLQVETFGPELERMAPPPPAPRVASPPPAPPSPELAELPPLDPWPSSRPSPPPPAPRPPAAPPAAPPAPPPPAAAPPLPELDEPGLFFQQRREGAPSPYTEGARLSYDPRQSAPAPLPPRRPMRKATFESVLSSALEDEAVEGLMVRLHRVLPDPGYLEDLDVRDAYEHTSSLGALRAYLKANHYDGRPTKVRVHLLVNDEEAGDGPWTVDLPKDALRLEEARILQEVAIAKLRAQHGLAGAPAPAAPAPALPPAPPPPVPEPQGGLYTAAQLDQAIAAALGRLLAAQQAPAAAPAPAPDPAAAPAPAPAPAEQVFSKADVEAKINEAVERATAKGELEAIKEKAQDAKNTLATLAEIAGVNGGESKSEPDDPTIEKHGVSIPREMFNKSPNSALLLSNWPLVQGLIGSVKDGVKEVVQEVVKAGREQLDDEEKRLQIQERKLALAERAKGLRDNGKASDPGVVESSSWAPPRVRPAQS